MSKIDFDETLTSFDEVVRRPSTGSRRFGSDDPLRVPAMHDVIYPAVPFPSARIFREAGEAAIRRLVHDQHERLRDSPVGALFPADEQRFRAAVERSEDFFVEMLGGPDVFTSTRGQPALRERHFPVSITEADRLTWLDCLAQAMVESGFPASCHEELWNWVEPLSIRMINRRTTMYAVERLPFADYPRFRKGIHHD
ncbi:MAG TPA: hypothetical protein VK979_06025 [Guyparkeria sp.]|nr:hypothetical protein [Guyparkeria sp.]